MELKNTLREVMMQSFIDYFNTYRDVDTSTNDTHILFSIYDGDNIELINFKLSTFLLGGVNMVELNTNNKAAEFFIDDTFFTGFVTTAGTPNRFRFNLVDPVDGVTELITGSIGSPDVNSNKDLIFDSLDPWEINDVVKISDFNFYLPTGSNEYL